MIGIPVVSASRTELSLFSPSLFCLSYASQHMNVLSRQSLNWKEPTEICHCLDLHRYCVICNLNKTRFATCFHHQDSCFLLCLLTQHYCTHNRNFGLVLIIWTFVSIVFDRAFDSILIVLPIFIHSFILSFIKTGYKRLFYYLCVCVEDFPSEKYPFWLGHIKVSPNISNNILKGRWICGCVELCFMWIPY